MHLGIKSHVAALAHRPKVAVFGALRAVLAGVGAGKVDDTSEVPGVVVIDFYAAAALVKSTLAHTFAAVARPDGYDPCADQGPVGRVKFGVNGHGAGVP